MNGKTVLDASALLALLMGEDGSVHVSSAIALGAVMSTVNVSEVAAKLYEAGISDSDIVVILSTLPIDMIAFEERHALLAAKLRLSTKQAGLSLGDRACLALAKELGIPAMTADQAWSRCVSDEIRIVCIRQQIQL